MVRQRLRCVLISLLSAVVGAGLLAAPASAETEQPEVVVVSGGWGHGIGLSQYGAYGRAEAGHSAHDILGFYYPGTTIASVDDFGSFAADDDVDVLIDVRATVAVSTPWIDGGPEPDWAVSVAAGDEVLFEATSPVSATYVDGRWQALVEVEGEDVDRCADDPRCVDVALSFTQVGGTHVVLEEVEDGPNLGNPHGGSRGAYARGRIVLHPGALGGGCGSGDQFCVIHADLDLQDYLKGIAEVPSSWPAAAQEAQAVAARSYAASAILRRAGNGNAWDLYDSVQDQYYAGWYKEAACGGWCAAVDATDDEVVVHDGTIAETYYSSSNGGSTVEPPDVWSGGSPRPYLQAVPDPFDGNPANPNARREFRYTVGQVSSWIADHLDDIGTLRAIEFDDVPESGRITFARVVLRGSAGTIEVDGIDFYSALRNGCLADADCDDEVRSTNLTVEPVLPFVDVEYADYFYLPVQWMTLAGLTTGVSPTEFGSALANDRAQIATFLWRFAGEPAPASPHGFDDVGDDRYYADAVAWMRTQGITTGTSATEFSPERTVTRAEAAAFLWRFAGSPEATAEIAFTDVPEGSFYTDAVRWMVAHDITTGTTPTTFSPDDELTRAQIATFLWRLAGAPAAFADGAELPPAMRE